MVVKAFPPKTCLIIGSATEDYPFVVRTPALNYAAETTGDFSTLRMVREVRLKGLRLRLLKPQA
jgi:hypothetical protein